MSLDQVYALGALLTAHGCDPGWVDSAPASAPVGVDGGEAQRERVMVAVAEALGGAFDCLRVWSAWQVGTMGEGDFHLVADDPDRLGEIADAAIAALSAQPRPDGGEAVAWQIFWSPVYSDQFELTSDPMRVAGVRNLEDPPKIAPLYTHPDPDDVARLGEAVSDWLSGGGIQAARRMRAAIAPFTATQQGPIHD